MPLNHKILYTFAHTLTLCGLASCLWFFYALSQNQLTENGMGMALIASFVGFGAGHALGLCANETPNFVALDALATNIYNHAIVVIECRFRDVHQQFRDRVNRNVSHPTGRAEA